MPLGRYSVGTPAARVSGGCSPPNPGHYPLDPSHGSYKMALDSARLPAGDIMALGLADWGRLVRWLSKEGLIIGAARRKEQTTP